MIPVKEHLRKLERILNPISRSDYLRLDKNENIIGFEKGFIAILRQEITSDFLTSYPEVNPLYQKIARWTGCKPENIYLTAGSDAAIKSVFEVFVEPEDIVALVSPTYAMYYVYAKMFQADIIEIPYHEGLALPPGDILNTITTQKPKLLCIANPNSPTGTILSQNDLTNIISTAKEQNTIVLIDEAYYLFYPNTCISLIDDYPNLVVTRTFSKALGLASARLGFAAAQSETAQYLMKVRPMYESNSYAVRCAELVLDNMHLIEQNLEVFRKGKACLEKELDRLKIPHFQSYANFVLIDVGSYEESIRIGTTMYKQKILIGSGFKDNLLQNFIRVTVGSEAQMKYFIEKLGATLRSSQSK